MNSNFSNSTEQEIQSFYEKVSKNVKKYRKEKGMSQLDLALEIGVKSVAFYSNCESNRYDKHFNLEHIYKLSKALHVNMADLLK